MHFHQRILDHPELRPTVLTDLTQTLRLDTWVPPFADWTEEVLVHVAHSHEWVFLAFVQYILSSGELPVGCRTVPVIEIFLPLLQTHHALQKKTKIPRKTKNYSAECSPQHS